jgi:hypothetical protein
VPVVVVVIVAPVAAVAALDVYASREAPAGADRFRVENGVHGGSAGAVAAPAVFYRCVEA